MNQRGRWAMLVVLLALSAPACGGRAPGDGATPALTTADGRDGPPGAGRADPPFAIVAPAHLEAEARALANAFAAAHPQAGRPLVDIQRGPGGDARGEGPARFVLSRAEDPAADRGALRLTAALPAPEPAAGEERLSPGSPFVLAPEGDAAPRATLWLRRPGEANLTETARLFWDWAAAHGQQAIDAAPRATLAVVGDLQLARGLETKMARHGVGYPLELVAGRLAAADLTIANLESPFGRKGKPLPGKGIWFRARPEAVAVLARGGIDAVAVANNHILDYDTENFLETLGLLRDAGVRAVGGGVDLAAARRPVLLEAKGIRVALLAYSEFADLVFSYAYPRPFAATDARPGVAPLHPERVKADIAAARERADVVAVMLHWGDEYENLPHRRQVEWAHAFVDAGADLVLGFHPHAVQGFEVYKHGLIAYSLGNFVMDQWDPVTVESMLLEIALTRRDDGKVTVGPVRVAPVGIRDFRPHLLAGPERERLWEKMRRISAPLAARGSR